MNVAPLPCLSHTLERCSCELPVQRRAQRAAILLACSTCLACSHRTHWIPSKPDLIFCHLQVNSHDQLLPPPPFRPCSNWPRRRHLLKKAHSHQLKWETISLLPFLSKTFEGAVLKRMTNFLSQSHLLDRILYDFKCGSYRNDPVVGDRGCQQKPEQPFSLPLSLSDAFDAVNKLNLLSILSGACGIWIKLFVSSAIYPFFCLEG